MGSSRRLWLVSVVVGVGLGAFSVLADGIIGGRLFGILGNIASPWGLAAFFVGRLTTSPKRGALAGALTLLVGVAVYYAVGAARGYVVGEVNLVWTAIAVVAGPVMGWSGAAISAEPERPPSSRWPHPRRCSWPRRSSSRSTGRSGATTSAPRRIASSISASCSRSSSAAWRSRWFFEKDRHRRRIVYLIVALAGVGGAIAFVVLRELISRIA